MDITNNFKNKLRDRFIALLDSKRGVQSALAKSVGKTASYFSEIRRGNPVNAIHLRAVGMVFGVKKVQELLGIANDTQDDAGFTHSDLVMLFQQKDLAMRVNLELLKLEKINPDTINDVLEFIKFKIHQEVSLMKSGDSSPKNPPKNGTEGSAS